MRKIKCVVVGINSNGLADYLPIVVTCTQEQFDNADHVSACEDAALERGYESPIIGCDENEPLFKIFNQKQMGWHDAVQITV